jgi:hypothetical protein
MRRASSPSALRRLRALSWAERVLLAEAVVFLAAARAAVVLLPFRVLARGLGTHMAEAASPRANEPERLRGFTWALGAAAARTPWRSACLEQAIAAKAMLRRRGIPTTLYLGVARPPDGGAIAAHAWLRSGTVPVTGGSDVEGYAVVATFADEPRTRA